MLKHITKGNVDAKGKPRVYVAGTVGDVENYVQKTAELLFGHNSCAVYYNSPADEADVTELECMQLVVLIVTRNLLYGENAAYSTVFPFAMKKHIPVLPIIMEKLRPEDIGRLNEMLGDIQCLDPASDDPTEIPFDEKLKRYIDSVLIGSELAEEVRRAFDAYIFLSYRKKDRQYANELMRMIHSNDFARDIAVWFDEYLVPGENFNDSIRDALEKSDLFTMAVTPNLVNEENYIHTTEYPEAVKRNKKILPVEMCKTDMGKLSEQYGNIPDCVKQGDRKGLSQALIDSLENIAKSRSDDPQHNFLIGIAYLAGIDVERDAEKAVELITSAAEEVPQALKKLVDMYLTGDGVNKDISAAIGWQKRFKQLMGESYDREKCFENAVELLEAVSQLAEMYRMQSMYEPMRDEYAELLNRTRTIMSEIPKRYVLARYQLEALHGLAYYFGQTDRTDEELKMELEAFGYSEYCLEHVRSEDARKIAERDYSLSARRVSNVYTRKYDYENANKYASLILKYRDKPELGGYEEMMTYAENLRQVGAAAFFGEKFEESEKKLREALDISKQINTQYRDRRSLKEIGLCDTDLGRLYCFKGRFDMAAPLYRESLNISRRLIEDENDVETLRSAVEAFSKSISTAVELNDLNYAAELEDNYLSLAQYTEKLYSNVDTRKDLARCYEGIARVEGARGNAVGALNLRRAARNIYVAHYNANKTFYPALDLAECDKRLWEFLLSCGDEETALKYCDECIGAMYEADIGEVEYGGRILFDAYYRAGLIFKKRQDEAMCERLYSEAFEHFIGIADSKSSDRYRMFAIMIIDELLDVYFCTSRSDNARSLCRVIVNEANKLSHIPDGRHYMAKALYSLCFLTSGEERSESAAAALGIWNELVRQFPDNEEYSLWRSRLLSNIYGQ